MGELFQVLEANDEEDEKLDFSTTFSILQKCVKTIFVALTSSVETIQLNNRPFKPPLSLHSVLVLSEYHI